MEVNEIWNSPDGQIHKNILRNGTWDPKPTENCECVILISNLIGESIDVEMYNNAPVVIGDIDTAFGRVLDKCLQTMRPGEVADVQFNMRNTIKFTLELKSVQSKGLIYEWSAKQKFDLGIHHKTRGVDLFDKSSSDASHHFAKALKLLASIPIEIDEPPFSVDGVEVAEIYKLKANLYNNLSSCYLRAKKFENVIYLCRKVLDKEPENPKALYKTGVAYYEIREFDQAFEFLKKLLDLDPSNKAALDKLRAVKVELEQENKKTKEMARKMFGVLP